MRGPGLPRNPLRWIWSKWSWDELDQDQSHPLILAGEACAAVLVLVILIVLLVRAAA